MNHSLREVAHSIADDIERMGKTYPTGDPRFRGTRAQLGEPDGPCCVIVNPTIDRLIAEAEGRVPVLARIARQILGAENSFGLGRWSDTHTTEQVVSRLRAIEDEVIEVTY
jgi:hypothetical protein